MYTVAGTMKKGRSGHVLTVLCAPEREREMAVHILRETTTNGLRIRRCAKYFLTPKTAEVNTQWGPVRVKMAQGYGVSHRKPEYEDVARIAAENQIPYQQVSEEVLRLLSEEEKC